METKFKCKDEIIFRYDDTYVWQYGIFSNYSEDGFCLVGAYISKNCQILPYEGNQHLVGTTDSPVQEEKLEVGEIVIVADTSNILEKGFGTVGVFRNVGSSFFCVDDSEFEESQYYYCIRLSDLTSPDRKDKIMKVTNGKIVKAYK